LPTDNNHLRNFLIHTSLYLLAMSHESPFTMQSPNFTRSYTYQFKPYASGNSQMNPLFQQTADKPPHERNKHVQESRPSDHQMLNPDSQVDWIMDTLQQETSKHNETRMILQSSRQTNVQLERLLYQERSFNHSLRVNAQDAEIRRITAESRARAYEQQAVSTQGHCYIC
jgi:hypothetical protein